MLNLPASLSAWNSDSFAHVLQSELQQLEQALLPLQAGLMQSSYVSDSPIQISILRIADTEKTITARVAVFYQGIIAGSCCADDPGPVDEQNEYCELDVVIDKTTAAATISLVKE